MISCSDGLERRHGDMKAWRRGSERVHRDGDVEEGNESPGTEGDTELASGNKHVVRTHDDMATLWRGGMVAWRAA
jgi:hypothetical protein